MHCYSSLTYFQGGQKDALESIGDFLLEPLRLGFGYQVKVLSDQNQIDVSTFQDKLASQVALVAFKILSIVLLPFTTLGFIFNQFSDTYNAKCDLLYASFNLIEGDDPNPVSDISNSQESSEDLDPEDVAQRAPLGSQIPNRGVLNDRKARTKLKPKFQPIKLKSNGFGSKKKVKFLNNSQGFKKTSRLSGLPFVIAKTSKSISEGQSLDSVEAVSTYANSTFGKVCSAFKEAVIDSGSSWKKQKYYLGLKVFKNIYDQQMPALEVLIEVSKSKVKQDDLPPVLDDFLKDLEVQDDQDISVESQRLLANSSTLLEAVVLLLNPLRDLTFDREFDYKKLYQNFVQNLRFIINQPYYSEAVKQKREGSSYDQSLDVLLDIAYSRFKNLEIGQFCYNVVSKAILLGRKEQGLSPAIPRIDLAEKLSLEEQFEAIDHLKASEFGATRAGVNYGNFRGALDLQFDPHLETNLPYALYHIPKEVFDSKFDQVDVLRFGTPTRSGEVIEEFKAFLQALQFKGEKHLYVNMQHFDEGAAKFNRSLKSLPYLGYWFAGSHHMLKGDNMRSFAIHELQEEFGDAFVFVSLAQDSSFYHQKEGPWMYETSIAFQEFAQEFFNQFENLKGLSGIYLPEILKTDLAFMQKAKDLMSEVHKALFEAKPNLSKQERKDFIEIYYAFFELMLIKTLNISSMNIACKDAIDRAGKSNALLFKLLSLVNGDRDESVKEKSFVAITHGPAFLVKKQAILEHRRERLVSAIKYFEKPTARESVEGVFDFMELRYSEDSLGDKRVKVVFDEADQAI